MKEHEQLLIEALTEYTATATTDPSQRRPATDEQYHLLYHDTARLLHGVAERNESSYTDITETRQRELDDDSIFAVSTPDDELIAEFHEVVGSGVFLSPNILFELPGYSGSYHRDDIRRESRASGVFHLNDTLYSPSEEMTHEEAVAVLALLQYCFIELQIPPLANDTEELYSK